MAATELPILDLGPVRDVPPPDNPPQYEPMQLIDYVQWYIDTDYKRSAGGTQALFQGRAENAPTL